MKILSAGAAVLVGACSATAAVAEEPSLVGTWTGERERIAQTEGYRNGSATLVVTDQQGRTVKGYVKWSTPNGDMQDPMVAAFTPGGRLMAGADAEGTYVFELVDPTTLDYCYAESGGSFRTTCARLKKQP